MIDLGSSVEDSRCRICSAGCILHYDHHPRLSTQPSFVLLIEITHLLFGFNSRRLVSSLLNWPFDARYGRSIRVSAIRNVSSDNTTSRKE